MGDTPVHLVAKRSIARPHGPRSTIIHVRPGDANFRLSRSAAAVIGRSLPPPPADGMRRKQIGRWPRIGCGHCEHGVGRAIRMSEVGPSELLASKEAMARAPGEPRAIERLRE